MSKLFSRYVFLNLPIITSTTVFNFKKSIYKRHGAGVRKLVTSKTLKDITHILVDEEKLSTKKAIVESLDIEGYYKRYLYGDYEKLRLFVDLLLEVSFVKDSWVNECIKSGTLLKCEPFLLDIRSEIVDTMNAILQKRPAKRRKKSHEGEYNRSEKVVDKLEFVKQPINYEERIRNFLNQNLLNRTELLKNPNLPVIKALTELRNEYEALGDDFRVKGYDTALNSLLLYNTKKLTTATEAIELQGVGKSVADKIEEFAKTGQISKLHEIQINPSFKIIKKLSKVYGIGPSISKKLHSTFGIENVEELSNKKEINLNDAQKWGIKYYYDWIKMIPRDVSDKHYEFVKKILLQIEPNLKTYLMGSYRRGRDSGHDIDFIITRPDGGFLGAELINKITTRFKELGYIKCVLSGSHSKYLLGAKLESDEYCRRVDFLFVEWKEIGAAMMYFTGNSLFNRLTRQLANYKGYTLNQHGLFEKSIDENNSVNTSIESESEISGAKLVEAFDERKIFKHLGLAWREPNERNIGQLY